MVDADRGDELLVYFVVRLDVIRGFFGHASRVLRPALSLVELLGRVGVLAGGFAETGEEVGPRFADVVVPALPVHAVHHVEAPRQRLSDELGLFLAEGVQVLLVLLVRADTLEDVLEQALEGLLAGLLARAEVGDEDATRDEKVELVERERTNELLSQPLMHVGHGEKAVAVVVDGGGGGL